MKTTFSRNLYRKDTHAKQKHYAILFILFIAVTIMGSHYVKTVQMIDSVSAASMQEMGQALPSVKDYAWRQVQLHGLDPVELIVILDCESKFNPQAINVNTNKSFDLGVAQWNNKYHPEISTEDKLNPYKSIDLMIHTRLKDKNYHQWACASLRNIK